MMKQAKIEKAELERLYVSKSLSTYSIGDIYKCDPKTVYRYLKIYGIQTRPKIKIDLSKTELERLYHVENKSLKVIAKEYGYSAPGVLKKFKEFGVNRRSISEAGTKHPKFDFGGSEEDKAYLIGFRLGDLGVRERPGLLYISSGTTKAAQIKLLKNLFTPYGPVWVGSAGKSGARNISCSLNKSFSFLLPKHPNIPSRIIKSDPCFFSFFAGYTDAEGNFAIPNGRACLRIRSYDIGILSDMHRGLFRRGITSTFSLERKAGIYSGTKQNKDCWRLAVAHREELCKLLRILLPLLRHEKRKEDARSAMDNVTERIPLNILQSI